MASIMKSLGRGGGKIVKAASGIAATGRHGGVLQKAAAGPMGHPKPAVTDIRSDRGSFKIKG